MCCVRMAFCDGFSVAVCVVTFPSFSFKVVHENTNVELHDMELESGQKGKQVAEKVLAVANSIRTNFGTQSTLILTTYRQVTAC